MLQVTENFKSENIFFFLQNYPEYLEYSTVRIPKEKVGSSMLKRTGSCTVHSFRHCFNLDSPFPNTYGALGMYGSVP